MFICYCTWRGLYIANTTLSQVNVHVGITTIQYSTFLYYRGLLSMYTFPEWDVVCGKWKNSPKSKTPVLCMHVGRTHFSVNRMLCVHPERPPSQGSVTYIYVIASCITLITTRGVYGLTWCIRLTCGPQKQEMKHFIFSLRVYTLIRSTLLFVLTIGLLRSNVAGTFPVKRGL